MTYTKEPSENLESVIIIVIRLSRSSSNMYSVASTLIDLFSTAEPMVAPIMAPAMAPTALSVEPLPAVPPVM